jgi:carboxyl-terminal processing protease
MTGLAMFVLGAALAFSVHAFVAPNGMAIAASSETYRQLDLFGRVFERVRTDYVEEPNDEELIESSINGMLNALDPHSSYLSAKNYRDMQVQTRGEFGGLGIEVTMENGLVKVITPIDDTPASRAGIMAGDFITHLDGEEVQGLTLNEAVEKMRGRVNTEIKLTVRREGQDEPIDFRVMRDIIKIRSVRSRREEDVGYIRITSFNEQTEQGLKRAIDELRDEIGPDLKGFVLDLRNNPGGLLDQAIAVSDAFLDRGEIVSTRGRNPNDTQRHNARQGDITSGARMAVLINGGSASASEIVAGALQDHERAFIIGTRSFGKGSVQTIIPLGGNGGAMRLTTARYYTPAGRSIQAKGIDPDQLVEQVVPEDQKRAAERLGEASLRGHLEGEGGENTPAESEEPVEEESGSSAFIPEDKADDTQLLFALGWLRSTEVTTNTGARPVPPEQPVAN